MGDIDDVYSSLLSTSSLASHAADDHDDFDLEDPSLSSSLELLSAQADGDTQSHWGDLQESDALLRHASTLLEQSARAHTAAGRLAQLVTAGAQPSKDAHIGGAVKVTSTSVRTTWFPPNTHSALHVFASVVDGDCALLCML